MRRTGEGTNNRGELSHEPTRVRARAMHKFKSAKKIQLFLKTHAAVCNLFNRGRYLVSVKIYRLCILRSFAFWKSAAMV